MEIKDRLTLAALLREAAQQTIPEARFWSEARALTEGAEEPVLKVAVASAHAYWQMCHTRKTFLSRLVRSAPAELRQARDELNLIAAVLETGMKLPELADIYPRE